MKKSLFITLFSLLAIACNKDSDSDSSDAEYFFVGKLDGVAFKHEITASGDTEMATSNGGSLDAPNCTFDYGCAIGSFDAGQTYFSVDFPGLFSGDCSDETAIFPTLFPSGNWAFSQVEVSFFDGTELWTSSNGMQPGDAVFTVTNSEKIESQFGMFVKVRGTVTGTLYNDSGASKKMESGSFSLNFWPYF